MAWRGVVWRGVAWRGVAWRGVAWRGVVVKHANSEHKGYQFDSSVSLLNAIGEESNGETIS